MVRVPASSANRWQQTSRPPLTVSKVGDLVLVHNPVVPNGQSKKFQRPYQAQWIVSRVLPPNSVELVKQSPRYAEDINAQIKSKAKEQASMPAPAPKENTLSPRRSVRIGQRSERIFYSE
eukprot:m.619275 g.619275  ORF g.619275 m.619275 type:complete len:120 (-) comp58197_c0_seq5:378-737(-)